MISFLIDGAHAHDLATLLDHEGIAVRSGHHCAHPLMQFYGVPATVRASLAFYNTREEVDRFVEAIGARPQAARRERPARPSVPVRRRPRVRAARSLE